MWAKRWRSTRDSTALISDGVSWLKGCIIPQTGFERVHSELYYSKSIL